MDQFHHVNIKQEDDDDQKEVLIKNEEKRQDKQASSIHDNAPQSNIYIKKEFDYVEQNKVLINNAKQHSVQGCTKVKKEEKGGEIKLEWDGDECDCEQCRVEREIKIEFNQTNATEQVNRSLGPSEANKDASQQCKCVKKKKNEEDDCEYIGLWDKDCGCKRCTRNRNISIELNQTNAIENQQVNPRPSDAEDDASRKHTIQVSKCVEKEESAQARGDGDAREEDDGIDLEDEAGDGNDGDLAENDGNSENGDELDEEGNECQMSNESEDNETEIDDEEYEMEVDGGKSSDEETEVDEQSDLETESTSLKYKMVQKTAQIEISRIGKLYKCTFEGCNKQSKWSNGLVSHIRTHAFKCTWSGCRKTYSTQEKVRKHYLQHTREKESFKCTWKDCDAAYFEKCNLNRHYKHRHITETLYNCDQCGKGFQEQYTLANHMRTHTGEKPYKCTWDGCDREFARLDHHRIHLNTHTGKKPVKCPWIGCDKSFSYSSNMRIHYKLHTPELLLHKCEKCGKGFPLKRSLVSHMITHTGEKPYKCLWKDCEKWFSQSSSMRKHYKLHTPKLLLKCEQCGKGFQTTTLLKQHLTVHTGEKPFKCFWNCCDKSFSTKFNLKNHQKVHTGEKSFKCLSENCGRKFSEKSKMQIHYRTHTGEKPFKCPWNGCEKSFSQRGNLQRHHELHTR